MSRVLTQMLLLFPRAFREQFGADMAEQIRRDGVRASERGPLHSLGFSAGTALDLVRSAIAEHASPAWVAAGGHGTNGRGAGPMSDWTKDVRHALRTLRRSPGFTAVSVGMLGLAIGATAGIFSVVDTVLLNPLPFEDADRLVYIGGTAPGSDLPEEFGVSAEFYVHYSERSSLLEDVAIYNSFTATLRVDDRTERVRMSAPTVSVFNTLEATPAMGRLPTEEDDGRVMVISHALWTTWFGSDPDVVGRSAYTSFGDRTIVGVMGPEFRFPDDGTLLWIPNPVRAENITPGRLGASLVGRMAPGATVDALTAELTGLARELPERFGGPASYARFITQHRAIVRPLKEHLVGDVVTNALWVLLAAVGIVLLIACANVANLFMVRAERRQRELAIRRAIGAGRGRLFRAQMSEAVVVALMAGALAMVLAWVTVPVFLRAAPPEIPRLGDVHITVPTLLFTVVISIVAATLCGLLPSLRASVPDLMRLRDGSRGSTQRRHWARSGLVVAQTALALVLLIGSGLLVRSFQALRDVDPGYDTEDIFTFQIAPEGTHLTDGPSYARFHMQFMERIAGLPGVRSVGIVENVPLNEGTSSSRFRTPETPEEDGGTLLNQTFAAGDYFGTMGIALLAGRGFTEADLAGQPINVVISRTAANLLWAEGDPIGQRMRRGPDEWMTVIGVVEDVMQYGFRDTPQALVYLPIVGPTPDAWVISSPAYVVKTPRAELIAPEIRALVREVAPEAPMYRVFTMAGLARDSMTQLSFTMLTLGFISVLALILGTVGLYGVLSYVVAERTREIGVRMALGAEAKRVRRMVVGQGARVVVPGVLIGLLVAALATRALGTLLFGVGAMDGATFIGMSGAMVLVGLFASWVPAMRASSVDPIESMRSD